jgi:ABC-type multidrug transport system fused ATPase/permease subunit
MLTNLNRLMQDKTALFITHRLFFNFHCDLIIYIEDGHIAESGTPDRL